MSHFDRKPSQHGGRTALLSAVVCAVLMHASPSRSITLADSVTFTEKGSWSAMTLGIPADLAGIRFSSDGSTIYAVGKADVPASAMYAVPVVRDPNTNEIIDLGMASVTPFFSANVSTPAGGLDSGPEEGPAGTLFYTYFNANNGNFIGERRAGDIATEMQFDLAPKGVPLWLAGLAFAPWRIDPGTGFGTLQVSAYNGDPDTTPRDVYEVPLSPVGDGFFTPGTATRFLSIPAGDPATSTVNGLCYVPAGPFTGSLMYTSFDAGEVHYLDIDPATGLAIDSVSGLPQLGTNTPVDHLFASDLSVGPVGLDFDPLTNDLFISTFQGNPFNTIIQVGGFGASTTTTTTTTLVGSSTTTSSTTLVSGCLDQEPFASAACRLDALLATVQALPDPGAAGPKLERKLASAKTRLQTAESRLAGGHKRGAKGSLGKAVRLVRRFRSLLGSRSAQGISATVRGMLSTEANDIVTTLIALKQSI
jgi:hypothetical protein